jgi:hypothetical protein
MFSRIKNLGYDTTYFGREILMFQRNLLPPSSCRKVSNDRKKWYRYRNWKNETRVISIPEGTSGPEKRCFQRKMPEEKIFGGVKEREMGTRQKTRNKCRGKVVRKRPVRRCDPERCAFKEYKKGRKNYE